MQGYQMLQFDWFMFYVSVHHQKVIRCSGMSLNNWLLCVVSSYHTAVLYGSQQHTSPVDTVLIPCSMETHSTTLACNLFSISFPQNTTILLHYKVNNINAYSKYIKYTRQLVLCIASRRLFLSLHR